MNILRNNDKGVFVFLITNIFSLLNNISLWKKNDTHRSRRYGLYGDYVSVSPSYLAQLSTMVMHDGYSRE